MKQLIRFQTISGIAYIDPLMVECVEAADIPSRGHYFTIIHTIGGKSFMQKHKAYDEALQSADFIVDDIYKDDANE